MPRHTAEGGGGASERGRGARRRAVLHTHEEDEDDSSLCYLAKGYGGLGQAAAGLRCWARLLGYCWAVSAGKVQVSLLSFISFIYFLFYFLF